MSSAKGTRRGGAAAYALGVMIVAYVLAFIDRQVLNLLVEPLKRDLGLSDLQVSLLQGLSFALFLSVGSLPAGRLVDTRRRTLVLAAGVAMWSLATGACGLARNFGQLLLFRIGVGVGEATMTPSAYSLIGDLFGPRRLGLAMGLYGMGPHLGSGLALVLGGLVIGRLPAHFVLPGLGSLHGWQALFLALAPAGLVVALWVASLREPPRTGRGAEARAPWPEAGAFFRRNLAALMGVNLAVSFAAMAMYSLSAWLPSLLIRVHHLKAAQVGAALGWRVMVFGALGALAAGLIGDALRRRGVRRGRLMVMIAAAGLAAPLAGVLALSDTPEQVLALAGPLVGLLTVAIGSGPATLQDVTPNRLRGLQHAGAVLTVNVLGLGLGPSAVALVTDLALRDEGRLGLSLALSLPIMLALSVVAGLGALGPYGRSLAAQAA